LRMIKDIIMRKQEQTSGRGPKSPI
jgi:hypothetical protein